MKHLIILSTVLLAAISTQGQQAITTKAQLNTATVFSSAAELNHRASASLPQGSSEIVISNVANILDENSIQIGAPASVTIMSVRAAVDYTNPENKSPEYHQLQDTINAFKRTLSTIQNTISAEESTLALLDKNQNAMGTSSGVNVAELDKLAQYYKGKHLSIKNNITALREREVTQLGAIERLQHQLNELNNDQTGTGGQLVLQVISANAGNADFTVSYITPAAKWTAYYDLKAATTSSPLDIIYKANVMQSTGIQWEQVKLTLSTGNPSQGGTAPLLNPWWVRFAPEHLMTGQRNDQIQNRIQSLESRAPMPEVAMGQPAPLRSTAADYTTVSENQLSATFEIDMPYDISPNGRPHSVTLQQFSHPANFKYYAVPRLDPDAFLMAEITDYEKLNLIPGEANIIFENMFVGKSYINPYATTDTLNLSMGRDKMITIKRERVTNQTTTQTIGSNKRQTFTYEIRIRNNKRQPINLLLKDQYPLSTDKTIQVELLESGNAHVNAETGILTWKLTVAPGETQNIRLSYSVRYPKDKVLMNF